MFPGEDSLTLEEYMRQYCQQTSTNVAATCRVSEQTEEKPTSDKTDPELTVAVGECH